MYAGVPCRFPAALTLFCLEFDCSTWQLSKGFSCSKRCAPSSHVPSKSTNRKIDHPTRATFPGVMCALAFLGVPEPPTLSAWIRVAGGPSHALRPQKPARATPQKCHQPAQLWRRQRTPRGSFRSLVTRWRESTRLAPWLVSIPPREIVGPK